MTDKSVGSMQIYALQALFTLAYTAGVSLIVSFIVGAFLLTDWAFSFMVIELFTRFSVSIDTQVGSQAIALVLVAFCVARNAKNLKSQLIEYWMMIVNIKTINN